MPFLKLFRSFRAGQSVLTKLGLPGEENILTLIHDLFTIEKSFTIRLFAHLLSRKSFIFMHLKN